VNARTVIIRPIVSEKSYALLAANKYTFRIHEHAHALRHDFLADAVAGDDGDPVALHRSFTSRMRRFVRL